MCQPFLLGHLGCEFEGGPAWSKLKLQKDQQSAPTFTIDLISFQ